MSELERIDTAKLRLMCGPDVRNITIGGAQFRNLLDRIDSLQAAIDEARWQPIESAPRDGTPFLGYLQHIGIAELDPPAPHDMGMWMEVWWRVIGDNGEGEWVAATPFRCPIVELDDQGFELVGWMPRPAPPKEGE